MTQEESRVLWLAATRGLAAIEQSLAPEVLAQLKNLSEMMLKFSQSSSGRAAYTHVFQQFWNIALNQVKNVSLLRAMQPFIRPALGFWGTNLARIEICSLAISGALASEIFITTMLVIIAAAIVIALIMLVLWLINRGMQVPQGPKWQPLFQAVNDPTIGPVYTLNTGNIPSLIELPNAA